MKDIIQIDDFVIDVGQQYSERVTVYCYILVYLKIKPACFVQNLRPDIRKLLNLHILESQSIGFYDFILVSLNKRSKARLIGSDTNKIAKILGYGKYANQDNDDRRKIVFSFVTDLNSTVIYSIVIDEHYLIEAFNYYVDQMESWDLTRIKSKCTISVSFAAYRNHHEDYAGGPYVD